MRPPYWTRCAPSGLVGCSESLRAELRHITEERYHVYSSRDLNKQSSALQVSPATRQSRRTAPCDTTSARPAVMMPRRRRCAHGHDIWQPANDATAKSVSQRSRTARVKYVRRCCEAASTARPSLSPHIPSRAHPAADGSTWRREHGTALAPRTQP